jgi:hypothetical protein
MRGLNTEDEVRFCNLDEALDSTLPAPRARLLARFHVEGPDAKLVSGAAGFVAMWRALPPLRPLAAIAGNRFLLPLLERLYLVFLRIRPPLQRLMFWFESRHSKAPAAARRQSAP